MVVDQLREFLEHGNMQNAVNFPDARDGARGAATAWRSPTPTCPNMLGQISHALGKRRLNIHNMLNKSKGEMAYTLVDVDSAGARRGARRSSRDINGVLSVRYLPVR